MILLLTLGLTASFIENRYHLRNEPFLSLLFRIAPVVILIFCATFAYEGFRSGSLTKYHYIAGVIVGVVFSPLVTWAARFYGEKRRTKSKDLTEVNYVEPEVKNYEQSFGSKLGMYFVYSIAGLSFVVLFGLTYLLSIGGNEDPVKSYVRGMNLSAPLTLKAGVELVKVDESQTRLIHLIETTDPSFRLRKERFSRDYCGEESMEYLRDRELILEFVLVDDSGNSVQSVEVDMGKCDLHES